MEKLMSISTKRIKVTLYPLNFRITLSADLLIECQELGIDPEHWDRQTLYDIIPDLVSIVSKIKDPKLKEPINELIQMAGCNSETQVQVV